MRAPGGRRSARIALTLLVAVVVAVLVPLGAAPAQAAARYKILITGDSITQGSSGDYTWRYRLWKKLASTAPGKVSFVGTRTDLYDNVNNRQGSQAYAANFPAKAHSAVWGDSLQNELANIGSQVTSTGANVLVIMLGSNDVAYLTSPAATISHLTTYIQRARAAHPGIDVVVGEVLDRYDPWVGTYQITPQANEYADRLKVLASQLNTTSERVVVAPTRTGWDAASMTWDGTHPNPTGEALIAQRISQGLAQIGIGSAGPDVSGARDWGVSGPRPTLTPGSEQVGLGWNRAPSGATGMFIEQRLINAKQPWTRLPYAVSGNGWTAAQLVAGGTYQYRLVPSKGSSTGVAGALAQATPTGPAVSTIASVAGADAGPSSFGGRAAGVTWSTSTNATAYQLSYRMLSNGSSPWTGLPYPVTKRSWTFEPLFQGRHYQFRVQPSRGYLNGQWTSSAPVHLSGWPANMVQVSLGDSYSSGLGSSSGYYGSPSCLRSSRAWPNQIFSDFRIAMSLQACPDAVAADVRRQLPGMNSFFAARRGNAQLITLTVGGNDIGFADELATCVYTPCDGDETFIAAEIRNLQPVLKDLYAAIKAAQPHADIIVGGYPDVVEQDGTSGNFACIGLSDTERDMIDRLTLALNAAITSAASAAGVWTVGQGARYGFAGHGACASGVNAWIHDFIGTAPPDGSLPIDPRSFHPNDSGQSAYAIAFTKALNAYFG